MGTLELIRAFREVAVRGSFAHAARALEVSRANVSKYVAELERRMGVRLLNRSTHTVSLTDAGRLLLERSTPLIDMMAATQEELQSLGQAPRGRLRLTAPHGLHPGRLSRLLAAFLREYPHVAVCLELNDQPIKLVDEGVDLALRVGAMGDSNLIARKLQPVQFVVCATPAYWQTHGVPAHPDALAEHEALMLARPDGGPHDWWFEVDGQPHRVAVHGRMQASDTRALVEWALHDLGVLCLPDLLLQPHLADGALQPVLQDYATPDLWLYAGYPQRRHNSAALTALLNFLEQHWPAD